jgi:hypothetical protein
MIGISLWIMWIVSLLSYHKLMQGNDHKYVVNLHFDQQSFSNGRWQDMQGGPSLIFHFKYFLN